jgi:UDP-GlcNAc:undecaprenyl-phosphate GlcNAc-1-phosphate transferase
LTAVLFSGSQIAAMLSGGIILVSIGLVDDIYRIDAYRKLVFQIIAAVTAVAFGVSVPAENRILSTIVSIAWLVILPNAFNLIDGLDGLCGRTALVSALALFFMGGSYPALALAGALLGFLPFNLHPARMFLGDTGSLFIGFALGVISLKAADGGASHAAIALIFALPLADMSFAFFRRILNGKSPFAPDRAHFHHKLVDIGFLHAEASMLLSLVALALCSLAILI